MISSFLKLLNKSKIRFDFQTYPNRNKTVKFTVTDTEELWKKNKKKKKFKYYLDKELTYKLNNYGYRTPYNFKKGDEVNIFLGCSHTFGYGIHLENTWPYLLTEEIGGNIVNLAIAGCSIDRQFRELYYWMNFFKIKNIFHFQPIYAREEFLNDKGYHKFSVQDSPIEILNNVKEEFLIDNFGSDIHIMRKYVTNILSIESISNRIGCDYYYIHELPEHDVNGIPARDNMHMDVNGHKKIYKQFLEKYINKENSKDLLEDDFNLECKNNLI
jgi:hypothetical protein